MDARDLKRPRSLSVHPASYLDLAASAALFWCPEKEIAQIRIFDVGEPDAEATAQKGDDCGGS